MSPRTIDQVLTELDEVVATCRSEELRAGYFAALYRDVTRGVRDSIRDGRFEDGARMERMDVLFADRYLEAWESWRDGRPTTAAWRVAFHASESWWPVTLQHLLLGINAHINLDLGIATARVVPAAELPDFQEDFRRINLLLESRVDQVQERLAEVWPLLRVLDWAGGRTDEVLIHFSIDRAREAAWGMAQALASAPSADAEKAVVRSVDGAVAELGGLIQKPGLLLSTALGVVRAGELRSVPGIIDLLSGPDPS